MELLAGLTENQKSAVTHKNGPVLVVAGAGTGKTSVITRRIVYLIENKIARPEEILALTFTEKAALEMVERVDELSVNLYSNLQISTFHSFGSEIISEFAFELGLPADYKVLTDVEQILFMRDHIFEFEFRHFLNLSEPTSLIKELLKTFSRYKDENIEPQKVISHLEKKIKKAVEAAEKEEIEKEIEVARAYQKYESLMREEGYIDYGDQINLVLKLLKKPSIKKILSERYKYVLVDEFQDTNAAQNEMILEMFGKNGNVMVVGDDDQSIYKFRGAAISNILDFKENFKNPKTIVLVENFRSTQKILDASYQLIQNNNPERLEAKYQINKKLVAKNGAGVAPELMLFESESQEAEAVVEKIIEKKEAGFNFSDMAILFRANSSANEFVRTLKKHGVPFVFSGAAGLYEKMEVKMLFALTSVLTNPSDDLALYHLAMSDVYNVSATDLSKILNYAKMHNRSLGSYFQNPDLISGIEFSSAKTTQKIQNIITDVEFLREESKNATAGEVINLFLRKSGYYSKLTREAKEGSVEAHNKISNVAAFFDKIIHFQRNYKDHSLVKFSEYLSLVVDVGDDPKPFEADDGLDAVKVLTIHKAKGLEFEIVFVSSLSDSHMPGRYFAEKFAIPKEFLNNVGEEIPNAEERRLFYVAMTRAKKELYLTAAQDYGTKKTHKISRFIIEALGDNKIEKRFLKTEPIERIKHFEKVENLYGVKIEPIPDSEKLIFSRAAIDDYVTCPFKYQLIHVTPIRIIADSNVAYGNAIHNTIGEYYKRRMAGKNVKMSQLYEWFDAFWNESGFLSKIHEQKRYEKGKEALLSFYSWAQKESLPLSIEKEFKFALGNDYVKGRYDAIFGDAKSARIFDFKTSNVKTQKDADQRTKKSSQLATYALSWHVINSELPESVHLYFIDTGIIGNYVPSEKDVASTKEEIKKAAKGIRARNFEATPDLFTCKYCPFKFYCPVAVNEKTAS